MFELYTQATMKLGSLLRSPPRAAALCIALGCGWGPLAAAFFGASLSLGCKPRKLDVISDVPAFTFSDQSGKPFGSRDLQGKVSVAAFMFTRCPTICPRITATMQELQARALTQHVPIHWVSFSVDPENDTPAVLDAYAKQRNIDGGSWSFLTGNTAEIRAVAEQGFKIAAEGKAEANAEHYGISHGSHLVLVDKRGRIRGYYRTLDDDAQTRLIEDAKLLMNE